jgi:hypothetical protein
MTANLHLLGKCSTTGAKLQPNKSVFRPTRVKFKNSKDEENFLKYIVCQSTMEMRNSRYETITNIRYENFTVVIFYEEVLSFYR